VCGDDVNKNHIIIVWKNFFP